MVILNTCHIREKAAEKVFSELGRLRAAQGAKAERGRAHDHRRRRLRRPGRGRGDPGARALSSTSCSGRRPITGCREMVARGARAPAARCSTPSSRAEAKFDSLPEARGAAGRLGLSLGPGRLRQVLHLLRRALYPRRRISRARRRRSSPRRAGWSPRARARSRCWARTSTPITAQDPTAALGPGAADRALSPRSRACAHPLHHLASARCGRRADRGPSRRAGADAVPASAGAVGLRPHAGGDEPPAHAPTIIGALIERLRARAAGHRPVVGFHRRLSRRERRAISRRRWRWSREIGFAQAFSFKYSARPGTPAALRPEQVPETVKAERLAELQALLADAAARASTRACVGRTLPVLFEKPGRHPGQLVGRSPYLQAVHAAGAGRADRRDRRRCGSRGRRQQPRRASMDDLPHDGIAA